MKKIKCSGCGFELEERMKFCPNCGLPVENTAGDSEEVGDANENVDGQESSTGSDLEQIDHELQELYPEESSDVSQGEDVIDSEPEGADKTTDLSDNQMIHTSKSVVPDKKIIIGIVAVILVVFVIIVANSGNKSSKATASTTATSEATAKPQLSISKPTFSSANTNTIGQLAYYEPKGWLSKEGDNCYYYYPDRTSSDAFVMIQFSAFDNGTEVSGNEEYVYEGMFNEAEDSGLTVKSKTDYQIKGRTFKRVAGRLIVDDDDYDTVMYVFAHDTGIYSFCSLEVHDLGTGIEEYLQELVDTVEFSECINGHDMSEWTVTKEATCTEEGSRTATCNRCGETVEETIPMTEHVDDNNWVVVTEVTESKSGLKATHCSVCGKEMQTETIELTTGQKNAIKSAKSYLNYMAFSRSGLIDQLEYEGYSTDDATFAVDNITVDWNEQAAKSAKSYLEYMSFSKSGLIDQLQYEGFTYEQAVYGVEQNGY